MLEHFRVWFSRGFGACDEPRNPATPVRVLDGMTLYQFASCPFCLRVRITLKSFNIEMNMKDIHRHPEFAHELIRNGGRSMVPCLHIVDDTGERWMYESGDIVRFLHQYVSTHPRAISIEAPVPILD